MRLRKIIAPLCLAGTLCAWSCVNDGSEGTGEDRVPVGISGISTRADGINGDKIFLTAIADGDFSRVYIPETPISFGGGLSSTAKQAVFEEANPYYPLGQNTINFFAYSGKRTGTNMNLVAGNGITYDAVLSNYGKRSTDTDVNKEYEGEGTPGSSNKPAELLEFRHVMTQLTVNLVVDKEEQPDFVDPDPRIIAFRLDDVVGSGTYPLTAVTPDYDDPASIQLAGNTSGTATIQKGVNYLVPNGTDLVNSKFSYLAIDEYVASRDDRDAITITPEMGSQYTQMPLWPGVAYELTITVQRLRVVSATIRLVDWNVELVGEGTLQYTPHYLTLDTGDYDNTGLNKINKVVLHSEDGLLYAGSPDEGETDIKFVTVPQNDVVRVDLYTEWGLLISATTGINYDYSSLMLEVPLSPAGMQPFDPAKGSNAADNPYLITNAVQFTKIGLDPNAYYRQVSEVDFSSLIIPNGGIDFQGFPVFGGVYDGNGYTIENAQIEGPGLVGVNNGELRNVRMMWGEIDATGYSTAGSLCGTNNGLILACVSEIRVVNGGQYVGGICGTNGPAGQIIGCLNTAVVMDGANVGGICGLNQNNGSPAIAACVNTGDMNIEATLLGGLCGLNNGASGNGIRYSYWLVGSAQRKVGEREYATGNGDVGTVQCAALDPMRMRDWVAAGQTDADKVLTLLNNELANYSSEYAFIIDYAATGLTWPTPVIK